MVAFVAIRTVHLRKLETNQPTSRGAHTGGTVLYWTIRLPPCDQIVERVNVWRKAEDDPADGAPKNNSVTHRLPPQLTERSRIIPPHAIRHPALDEPLDDENIT